MPTARNFSSIAVSTTLASAVTNATDTTIYVSSAAGFPSVPFTIVVGKDTNTQELMEVTAVSGTTWTVTRGIDGTTASSSSPSQPQFATVRLAASARDFQDANNHVMASTAVHGLNTGVAVVGDTATQTLTNKTIGANSQIGAGVTFTNNGTITGGTLAGTIAGSPTFSGSPQFTGTQTFQASSTTTFNSTPVFTAGASFFNTTAVSFSANTPIQIAGNTQNIAGAWSTDTVQAGGTGWTSYTWTRRWMIIGKTLHLQATLPLTGAGGTAGLTCTLPNSYTAYNLTNHRYSGTALIFCGSTLYQALSYVGANGTTVGILLPALATTSSSGNITSVKFDNYYSATAAIFTSQTGATLANGDKIHFSITLEVA